MTNFFSDRSLINQRKLSVKRGRQRSDGFAPEFGATSTKSRDEKPAERSAPHPELTKRRRRDDVADDSVASLVRVTRLILHSRWNTHSIYTGGSPVARLTPRRRIHQRPRLLGLTLSGALRSSSASEISRGRKSEERANAEIPRAHVFARLFSLFLFFHPIVRIRITTSDELSRDNVSHYPFQFFFFVFLSRCSATLPIFLSALIEESISVRILRRQMLRALFS